ncbi:peptidase U32 [Paenibacillus swuensis]|uniref:Peptidase U32 n=1 Tax=Paenibacillus swuensis TaxID=1178515 RepID=A0A172TK78_9BACL|nr:peptidase U32 family protein [Paenibacillus swuensis]ANE47217.1 peptidase U32 [Paenibacillus swuensis]
MNGNKPELLVAAGSLREVSAYIHAGADAVNIGEARFGMRLPGDILEHQLKEAVQIAHEHHAKVYVSVNTIMDHVLLEQLPSYLAELSQAGVDGVVFGDPAVIMAVRKHAPELKLHWNAEMTSTNYVTANYWGSKGAVRVVLARELNMEQVLEFKQKAELDVQVQVHGITNIYHSKRNLVRSYMDHVQESKHDAAEVSSVSDSGLYLIEKERQDERYPVYEDANGTHIMSGDDICMLENLHELMEERIDSLKIETLLKSQSYNETVIRAYRKVIDAYIADPEGYEFNDEWLEGIQAVQDPERELSYGFFYKEQVY